MCKLQVSNEYEVGALHHHSIAPGQTVEDRWKLASSSGWFDLSITQESAPGFLRRFAGHAENGKPSTSDPATFKEI
jgi:phospholipase C